MKKNYLIALGVLALLGAVAAYYFGSRTGKAVVKTSAADQLAKDITPSALSFDLSQYETFAQSLHVAFTAIFTDKSTIAAVFKKLRTKDDVLQLIKTFGTRDLIFSIDNYTLPQWIAYSGTAADVNDILQRNTIDYSF